MKQKYLNNKLINNTDILLEKKLSFIKSFSKEEYFLNGHVDNDWISILRMFETFSLFIKEGNYLELGCGTGIFCRFLYIFSNKKIIPYGVDNNLEAIKIAKKNNYEFANNFIVKNYFEFLKLSISNLKKFSTISIFIDFEKNNWEKLHKVIMSIIKKCKKTNFLIIAYDNDFLKNKDKNVRKFISTVKKISCVSIAGQSILFIGKDKKIHIIAEKLRKDYLKHNKDTKYKFSTNKVIQGIIVQKNTLFFNLKIQDNFKYKKTKKLKFFLTSNFCVKIRVPSYIRESVIEKVIDWKDIQIGDEVTVVFHYNKQKNSVLGVTKNIRGV